MRSEIKALHQRLKTTTVYVTHDQVEAMTMADRIAVMNEGRIEQLGEPLELYDRPANLFVAQFIGSPAMNVSTVSSRRRRDRGPRGALAVRTPAKEGQAVKYGIRPEHLQIGTSGAPGSGSGGADGRRDRGPGQGGRPDPHRHDARPAELGSGREDLPRGAGRARARLRRRERT